MDSRKQATMGMYEKRKRKHIYRAAGRLPQDPMRNKVFIECRRQPMRMLTPSIHAVKTRQGITCIETELRRLKLWLMTGELQLFDEEIFKVHDEVKAIQYSANTGCTGQISQVIVYWYACAKKLTLDYATPIQSACNVLGLGPRWGYFKSVKSGSIHNMPAYHITQLLASMDDEPGERQLSQGLAMRILMTQYLNKHDADAQKKLRLSRMSQEDGKLSSFLERFGDGKLFSMALHSSQHWTIICNHFDALAGGPERISSETNAPASRRHQARFVVPTAAHPMRRIPQNH
ncbi:hypothetical protein B0H14DRAFT_2556548 [Mycena olivaceomarginata]|nr:hypothetical protein B0H14DRAFT_2556548 [Mycena olivaceomarginata]